jgi:small subunit ribosomal protein S27e
MIPKTQSNFVSVQCTNCREKKVVFTHTTSDINCASCGQPLAEKTGGKAKILGNVVGILD